MPNSNVREFVVNSLYKYNSYLKNNILLDFAGYSYVYDAYSYVLNAIYDNEYVTAYALIQLNDNINEISGNFVSKSALSSQSYITSSSLNNYVTKTQLTNQSYLTSSSLDDYVSKTELSNQSYLVGTSLDDYVTKTQLSAQSYLTSSTLDLDDYVSKTELSSQSYLVQADLNSASYVSQTSLSDNSYAGYSYVYDAYSYLMTKISVLEISSGGSGNAGEGGIVGILLNGSAVTISNNVAIMNDIATTDDLSTYVSKTELSEAGYTTSGLPSVTSSDNGKVLMVVNGSWQLVSPSTIYSGNASPANANGNNGDIYIQTS